MVLQIRDQSLIQQIEQIAGVEQRTPEQIVAEAVRLYAAQPKKVSGVSFLLAIAGQGASGESDVSERAEAILVAEIDPVRGWTVKREDDPT
jgi:hypothetical protein